MKPFIPSNCHRCGYAGESNLVMAGPHVKQTCGNCNAYIKFYDKTSIPDLREIKLAIMELAGGDISGIEGAKKEVRFFKEKSPVFEKVQYWKLLIHFIKKENDGKQGTIL